MKHLLTFFTMPLPLSVLWLSLLAIPVLTVIIEASPQIWSKYSKKVVIPDASAKPIEDFTIIVPIYGDTKYLENIDYLAHYGSRVLFCTSTGETTAFQASLDAIAATHGFGIFRADIPGRSPSDNVSGSRVMIGTIRDNIVRQAIHVIDAPYVICIDADTTTSVPVGQIIGAMVEGGYDMASVRLVPSNKNESILTHLQFHEYNLAMNLRKIAPWIVSGGCHLARTATLRDALARHSMFYQGNDVEVGFLADVMGYRVGHVLTPVPTTVPKTFRAWWRQRYAWVGGEFRIYLMNFLHVFRHPFFFLYGSMICFGMLFFRWFSFAHAGKSLLFLLCIYIVAVTIACWRQRDRYLLLFPFYGLLNSLLVLPFGLVSYVQQAWATRNLGIMRNKVRWHVNAENIVDIREANIQRAKNITHRSCSDDAPSSGVMNAR